MSFEVILLSRAEQNFETIVTWIAANSPGSLVKWFDAYEGILTRLEREPHSFGYAPESNLIGTSVRQALFRAGKGQVYRMLFVVVGDEVRVLHIRGPGQDYVREDA